MPKNPLTIKVKCPSCEGVLKFNDTINVNIIKWFKCPHCGIKFCFGAFPRDFNPNKKAETFSIF